MSTNFNRLARSRETSPGVLPGSPRFDNCAFTGESLKPGITFVRSETITGKRAVKEHIAVGDQVSGAVSFQLEFGLVDWIIELANFDGFTPMVEAYNETADSSITQVTLSTQTALAAGAWKPGMLIETTGLAAAGNNKRFRAAAGTGDGTVVAPASTFTADDAAPAAGARVLCVGLQGAAGDISATATGLASAANLFANMPLLPGMGVKIGGEATANKFATAACNAFVPIKSIAADGSALVLDELPAGWATDAGTGKEIQIFVGDDSRTGEDVLTDYLMAWNTKSSPLYAQGFIGCAVNQLTLRLPLQERVTGEAQIVGFAGELLTALLDANPRDPVVGKGDVMTTGGNIARLTEGGVAIAAGIECQEMTWTLQNNLAPIGSLPERRSIGWNPGDALISITGRYRSRKKDILEKFYSGVDSRQFFVVYRGGQAYMVRLLRGTYTSFDRPVQGRNQEWTNEMTLEAKEDPETGLLFVVTRFRKWK